MQQVSRMIHMKVRLISKPWIRDFSVSVFHFTVFLLLTNSSQGRSQTIGSSQPIVAMVDDYIILPCYLEPAVDARDLTVEWTRPDLDPRNIHVMREGVELLDGKNPSYTERTSLSTDSLKRGDVSLKLSKVKLSDAGTYRCLVPRSGTECVVEIAVGSVSLPEIKISKDGVGVLLQCESKGWYPKPEVLWLDGEEKLLSAGPAETIRGSDGLYTVSSRVTMEKKHSKSFTCIVQQRNISQTRETHVHVADELFVVQASSAVRIAISLAVSFLCIVVILLVVWKIGLNKTKTTDNFNEMQLQMKEEKQRLLQMSDSEKLKYFEKTKVKLDEDLKKNKEELEQVQQVIKTLEDQKKDLKNQRDKLFALPQEDKTFILENKKMLSKQQNKNRVTKDEEMKNELTKTIEYLERRAKEHEDQIKNTDKLLETTDDLIITMTEKKAKLERDKEQIEKHLKETQRQREELQKKPQSKQQEREEERKDPSPDGSDLL